MYPTWKQTSCGWESEEQLGGTPDFFLLHLGPKDWRLKWRTSAKAERFTSAPLAKESVRRAVETVSQRLKLTTKRARRSREVRV